MIRFLTLGTTELEVGGSSVTSSRVIAQPKRLALLAYLTVCRPGGRHYRDTLLGLLWPDLNEPRARHALRQALYHLRRELGPGVLVGGNQAGVGVDPARLWCDAVAFQEAVAAGRFEAALDLYRGDFLPGFYSEGGPEYEQWLDGVRERLLTAAVRATWTLTDRAEAAGKFREACAWARHMVSLQPCDEGAARRLIRLLAETGQRAEALQAFRALSARLERHLGIEPVPETRALADAIRSGSTEELGARYRVPTGGDAPASASTLQRALAVLPFADLSGTGVARSFANGLTEILITELARRTCMPVSVLSRTSVEQYRDRECALPMIARELGADFILEGTVLVEDERVRVTAQLLAPSPERHLWADSFDAAFVDLLALQDRLAGQIGDLVTAALSRPGRDSAAGGSQ